MSPLVTKTRAILVASLAVLSSVETARPEPYTFDLRLRNLVVHGDRTIAPSVTFDVTNTGQQPHSLVMKLLLSRVEGWTPPSLRGEDLAPGATQSFAIASTDLRPGWNQLILRVLQDGHEVGNTYQEYRKEVPGGLPDLKIARVRRLSAGVYAFEVKNVGKAASGSYSVSYEMNNRPGWFGASPDPAPSLAPGRSLAFILRDLPEHVVNPKKDRFNLHLDVDHLNRIPESNEQNNSRMTGYGYNGSWAENHP